MKKPETTPGQRAIKDAVQRCLSAESTQLRDEQLRTVERDDPDLAAEVRALLNAAGAGNAVEQVFGFVSDPKFEATHDSEPQRSLASQKSDATAERLGTVIGHYKLLEQIGEGGMGAVFMAQQTQPIKRKVALKVIKPGMDTGQVVARFEAGRQALAMMDHPNIARVLDAGTTEQGRPYFVMELVRGIPITDYCSGHKLTTDARLKLFIDVCHGVQHAHQKGIIHRDLKPNNVLVTLHDGKPVVKIIDFGIAKAMNQDLTDRTLFTNFAQLIGTPLYMSPEQAKLSGLDVDTRSDVYSLGVLLYELLTGTTPFDRETLKKVGMEEIRRMIRETDPPKPSQRLSTLKAQAESTLKNNQTRDLKRSQLELQGELDWIVMKSLEKERERRYESASAFAADVQRYLEDESVLACPPSTAYRFKKFAKRNRAKIVSSLAIFLALILGSSLSVWQAILATKAQYQANIHATDARKSELLALEEQRKATAAAAAERLARNAEIVERQRAEKQAELAGDRLYVADMRLNSMDTQSANTSRLLENLLDHLPVAGGKDRRRWDWYYLLGLSHENQYELMDSVGSIASVAWSPNGKHLATSSIGGWVVIYETKTWKPTKKLNLGPRLRGLSWSPDSRHVSWGTSGYAGQVSKSPSAASTVMVFNVDTEELSRLYGSEASVLSTTWSPNGEQLASAGMDLKIRVWNWKTRECEMEFPIYGNVSKLHGHPSLPRIVASITTRDIAQNMTSSGLDAVVIDINQGPLPEASDIHDVTTCGWNTDGSLLAVGRTNGVCAIYDAKRWTVQNEWQAHQGKIASIEWSKDSQQVITGGVDRLIQIWNSETGVRSQSLQGSTEDIKSIALSPDGNQFATGVATGKIWSFGTNLPHRTIGDKQTPVSQLDWRSDSRTIDSIAENGIIDWDIDTGLQVNSTQLKSGRAIGINSKGERLAVMERVDERKEVFLHDLRTGVRIRSLCVMDGEYTRWFDPHCLCFNTDASKIGLGIPIWFKSEGHHAIAVVGQEDTIADLESYSKVLGLRGIAFSPDTTQIACVGGSVNSNLFLLNVDSGKIAQSIPMSNAFATCVAWSHDGMRIATGDINGMACVWDPLNRTQLARTQIHSARVHAVDWHPSDSLIASQGADRVSIWDPKTGEELIHLQCQNDGTGYLKWSPDGKCLAATDSEGRIHLWDASTGFEYASSIEFKNKLMWRQLSKVINSYQSGNKDLAYQMVERAIQDGDAFALSVPNWITDRWIDFVSRARDRSLCDMTLRLFPELEGFWIHLTRLEDLARAGKYVEAEKQLRMLFREKRTDRVSNVSRVARSLMTDGLMDEAKSIFELLIELEKEDIASYNQFAWLLANCPVESLRDGKLAVELAHKAVLQNLTDAASINTLGVALFRTGIWLESIRYLEKSIELRDGGDGFDWYFLAMAHWQLDQKSEALEWYQKALDAVDGKTPANDELKHFHDEATQLLEIEPKRPDEPSVAPNRNE